MDGILLIDKPKGPSSFNVVKKLRQLTGIKKIGHAGTLDPLASGLLVICLGRYTKLSSLITEGNKTYQATIKLGATTSTDDEEGEIIATKDFKHLNQDLIEKTLLKFSGRIEQIPPRYSAIKINGQRAYQLARAKRPINLVKRTVDIFDLSIKNCVLPEITVAIHCSKGTYVRSLARDVGETLGVGAYAKDIRRLTSGAFHVKNSLKLSDLTKDSWHGHLLHRVAALPGITTVAIDEQERKNIICGRGPSQSINFEGNIAVAIYEEEPIAILKKYPSVIKVARVI